MWAGSDEVVELLDGLDVPAPRDGDAVLGSFVLGLEFLEGFVCLQVPPGLVGEATASYLSTIGFFAVQLRSCSVVRALAMRCGSSQARSALSAA